MHAGPRRVVQLIGRRLVTEKIAPVIGKLQLLRLRMPIVAHGIANAARKDLLLTGGEVEACQYGVAIDLRQADIARRADRNKSIPSGPKWIVRSP